MLAQDAAILRQNQFEIGGFAGFSYGVDQSRAMGGGNVTYSALRWLLPYAEFSYFPNIERTFVIALSHNKEVYDLPLADYNFGVHARVRLPHTPIVPYFVAGIGLLHSPARDEKRFVYDKITQKYDITPTPVSYPAATNVAVNLGGGLRYYLREQVGLRAETKIYRLTGGPLFERGDRWLYRATFGFFIQFGR